MPATDSNQGDGASRQFPATHWSVILQGHGAPNEQGALALEHLCRAYWHPIYAFIRRSGRSVDDAQDLTQGFFARVIEKRYLDQVDPARGRFRSFLLGAVKHYLADEWDRSRALKRGGGLEIVSWDDLAAEAQNPLEPADGVPPEVVFDRRWALSVMARALARLEAEHVAQGRQAVFQGLKGLIAGGRDAGFAEVAAELAMTEGAAKMAVQRMRRRYREHLRAEVGQTVSSAAEIDEELRYLLQLVSV